MRLLERYRNRVCCFYNDIQCTGAIILAGLLCALRVTGGKVIDQRILFLGAGSAGVGIANLIAPVMMLEGLNEDQARSHISLFNTKGLLESSRTDLHDFQQPYAHQHLPSGNSWPLSSRLNRLRLSASAPKVKPSRNKSSRLWLTSTNDLLSLHSRIPPTAQNARQKKLTAGQKVGRSMRQGLRSLLSASVIKFSYRVKEITCSYFQPSDWRFMPLWRSV